ncbi:hypothetical protein [Natrialba taiwanensis]|uniref:Uncharacterized protein n=1 Tax=Natrialba taiwanensis DSM 12281 TaxID=1230458 RepID=M0A211_9EURY|nr:hypothetical protein [Natrialba taiwanensis]ELY91393.1 hypothetical protein C484_10811 [Natrialba taiwanensis DSM 12281]
MNPDRAAWLAGEPRHPEPDIHPPEPTLEEFLRSRRSNPKPEDVDHEELSEAIAIAGPEGDDRDPLARVRDSRGEN